MVSITIDIPDEMAMELNAHIAAFKAKLHIEIHLADLVLTALNGYLIDHSNNIEDYRIAHEPIKRQQIATRNPECSSCGSQDLQHFIGCAITHND